jgi:lipoprotein NlpD
VIATFNAGDNKGINIAGREGDTINAAAEGRLVYSGSGLVGLGELVIIKHNGTFLSAYAHNKLRLVKEGDLVKSGQTIAQMGRTGSDRVMLHFEVRKDGKPVDPLQYLPRQR